MYWLAGSLESHELKEMLEDFDDGNWTETFPEFNGQEIKEAVSSRDFSQLFFDHNKLGFLAEVRSCKYDNFHYEGRKIIGASICTGVQAIDYAYGETIEELMARIEEISEASYQRCIAAEKKKTTSKKAKQ